MGGDRHARGYADIDKHNSQKRTHTSQTQRNTHTHAGDFDCFSQYEFLRTVNGRRRRPPNCRDAPMATGVPRYFFIFEGFGFRVQGSGSLSLGVLDLGFRVQGLCLSGFWI
jgi:hypothetical protein